jgi:tetratricopeptide (TPR) repeat protein
MWRDDHIGDPVGAIFLGQVDDAQKRLADYFGDKVSVARLEIVQNQAHIDLDCFRFVDESNQLVTAAKDVRAKGLTRNAESLFREALALDPLNSEALLGLGSLLADRRDYAGALATLKRAREAAGDRPDILQALAGVSLKLDHPGVSIGYMKRAAELAPNDPAIRRALAALEPKVPEESKPSKPTPTPIVLTRDRRG